MSDDAERSALRAELEATRRALDILKRRVFELNRGGKSTLQRQLEAAERREQEARRRRELMEVRNAELEREIERRILLQRRISDNVKVGLLMTDRTLTVLPEFSRSCRSLLQRETIEGIALPSLLRLDGRRAAAYRLATAQIFDDLMPEALSIAQVPRDFHIHGRMLRVEPSVLRDGAGAVEGLLYTLSEVTSLVDAQREANVHRMLIGILRDKSGFCAFLDETRAQLDNAERALGEGDAVTPARVVHTIKGNSATYRLAEVVRTIHELESRPLELASIEAIRAAFRELLRGHISVLGIEFDDEDRAAVELSADQAATLRRLAGSIDAPELRELVAALGKRPAGQLLGPIESSVSALAEGLGKEVHFVAVGLDTPLDDALMRPICQNLIHLLRNAVDHGLELPDQRWPKPRRGRVVLVVEAWRDRTRITVQDDGVGVDADALAERAVHRGLLAPRQVEEMTEEEKLQLVFLDGVSTADAATEISGRGIGMASLRAAVMRADGVVHVVSKRGLGTTVVIEIPSRDLKRSADDGERGEDITVCAKSDLIEMVKRRRASGGH